MWSSHDVSHATLDAVVSERLAPDAALFSAMQEVESVFDSDALLFGFLSIASGICSHEGVKEEKHYSESSQDEVSTQT